MFLLTPGAGASDRPGDADHELHRTIGSAVDTYVSLCEEGPCLVPASVIPFARNDHHHFLLVGVDDVHAGQILHHDEGQGGVLHDDWGTS